MKRKFLVLLALICITTQGLTAYAINKYYEDESNDTMKTADSYSVDTESTYVYGTVNSYDDTDYFKLVASSSGVMYIKFYFDYDKASSDIDIDLYVYDSSENKLKYISNCDGSEYYNLSVDENDYVYVRVDYDAGYLAEPYRLKFYMK